MSPIDPLQNPVVRIESNDLTLSTLSDNGVQQVASPVQAHRLKKRFIIAPVLLLVLVATPLAVNAFLDYQKSEREKALLPKHRIVTL